MIRVVCRHCNGTGVYDADHRPEPQACKHCGGTGWLTYIPGTEPAGAEYWTIARDLDVMDSLSTAARHSYLLDTVEYRRAERAAGIH